MAKAHLRLIKNAIEFIPRDELHKVPPGTRGIYVLYRQRGPKSADSHHYDFVYIGLASVSIRTRLRAHASNRRTAVWTHYSAFEVWDNISDDEIAELEGLFRHLYRFDSRANSLNKQKGFKKLFQVKKETAKKWC